MARERHPFSFCEEKVTNRHFRYSSISKSILMKYIARPTTFVEDKIEELSLDRFAVFSDGFPDADAHYFLVCETF